MVLWGDKAQDLDADALIERSSREPVILLAIAAVSGCKIPCSRCPLDLAPKSASMLLPVIYLLFVIRLPVWITLLRPLRIKAVGLDSQR